jgi:hypothetical protein
VPTNCKFPGSTGTARFCTGTPVVVPFNAVTPSTSKYVSSLPINNLLSYRLYCPAFPDYTAVDLAIGTTHQTLAASSQSIAENLRQTVGYSALTGAAYIFTPRINYNANYYTDCKMEVLANLSTPNVDTLRTIVDLLKDSYTDLTELRNHIAKASELPAKWSAIKDSPETIAGLLNTLENEMALDQQEFAALGLLDKVLLSEADKVRLEELPGIIELYKGMVNDLKNLKVDIGDVATIASQCEANVDDAYCLDQFSKISLAIHAKAELKRADLVELNVFLTDESDRLKTAAVSISNALKRLLAEF